jgi:hypothetical protein
MCVAGSLFERAVGLGVKLTLAVTKLASVWDT